MYRNVVKPVLGRLLALIFVLLFWWLFILLAIMVRVKLGSPVFFTQKRPGRTNKKTGKEEIFKLYKFRTMTNERDNDGKLLPDEVRLTKFGKFLRSTSLDELPEIFFNVLVFGNMSWIGPRPQLVRDMVFMSETQRNRHKMKPGLSGLAQVCGRNSITWDEKLDFDCKYVNNVGLCIDCSIIIRTVKAVLGRKGITDGENATALDYGDYLLRSGRVSKEEYDELQRYAERLLEEVK